MIRLSFLLPMLDITTSKQVEMTSLQKEANPFQIQALKTWLASPADGESLQDTNVNDGTEGQPMRTRTHTETSIVSTASQQSTTSDTLLSFWVIPSSQLTLQRKVGDTSMIKD